MRSFVGAVLVVLAAAAGCRTSESRPPESVIPGAPTLISGDLRPHAPSTASYSGLEAPDRIERIGALVEATASVILDQRFHDHLAALSNLRATPDSRTSMTGEEVYRSYVGLDPTSRPGPVTYQPKWLRRGEIASCERGSAFHLDFHGAQTADTQFGGRSGSVIELNRCTFDRAAALESGSDVEPFACAVNTIAHEWTHTINSPNDENKERYLDSGHDSASGLLVSYTIGAIAQCTYLESKGKLALDFDTCVNGAGTFILKPDSCVPGWASGRVSHDP